MQPPRLRALRLLFLLSACAAGIAHAATAIDSWREEAEQTRRLAESDVPEAYAEAQRLQAMLPVDAPAADRIRALNLLARIETYLGHTRQADDRARSALALARANTDRVGQAEAQLTLALTSVNLGHIDELLAATANSVTILDGVERPDLLGEALLRTAMTYRRIGQTDEAVMMAMQAMEIAGRTRNPLALTYAHQGLGIAYGQSERDVEAREHFVRMREQARAAGSKLLEADALGGLAGAVSRLSGAHDAEQWYREAIALYREAGAPLSVNYGVLQLAQNLTDQRRFADASQLYDAAIATYERLPTPIGLWYGLNARSRNYESRGELAAARADAERADKIASQVNFPLYMSESARRLAELAARNGEHRRAYELGVRAAQLSSQASREKIARRIVELTQRYETESKRRQIEELTLRNAEQAVALQRRELQQRWLWTVLATGGVLLLGTAVFVIRLRSLNASLEQRVHLRTGELRQQTHYLRALIDTLPLSVWLKDTQSRYLAANRANAAACGLSSEEMVGKSDLDLWPPHIAEEQRADDAQVMATRQRKTLETLHNGPHGPRWIETFKAPVVDEDGALLGTVGAAHDITERKATETAREAALYEAERLARLRSDFVAQMSHELRTPLNAILGYAAVLRRDPTLGERQSAGVKVIQQSGEHLLRLINDVLDLAKIEAGKLELQPAEFALDAFLRAIASIVRLKAEAKHVAFSLEMEPHLPSGIRADEQRLRQVLLNLLANAITFTDGGCVCLRVSALSASRLRFEVADTGIGIDEHQREAIFQPFEQAADPRRRTGGTGLGLAISRKYVRLMGSDIEVESTPGAGSTFRFDLEVHVVPVPAERDTTSVELAVVAAAPEPLVTPPPRELADLHDLAMQGNMRDIVSWARRILELDERRYRAFARRVQQLAEGYESQAILALVREHVRDGAPT